MSRETQEIEEDFRVCAAQSEFELEFDPPPFRVNSAVNALHNRSPRFGHSSDFNLLIQGTREEQNDYLTGLLAASIAVFCLFVVWMITLWVFKCLGPSRVGFFSARRQLPTKPIKPEPVHRQERLRKKQPFQRNGEAGGYLGASPSTKKTKLILKPVVGVAKAPITAVTKARKRKRELEKRNQFSKMKNDSFDSDDDYMETEVAENSEQAPHNDGATSSSPEMLTDADRKIIRQYEQDWKEYERLIHQNQDRIRRIRIGAGFCAIGILISALMFTIMTQKELTTSLDNFDSSLNQVDSMISEALRTSNDFAEQQRITRDSTRKFLLQLNDICPNTIEQLCTNVDDETATTADERGCDFSTIPYGEELANMVDVLDTSLDGILEGFGNFEQDLKSLQSLLSDADLFYPKHGTWVFWTAAGCSLALGCIGVILTGGMIYLEMEQQSNGLERNLPSGFSYCRSWMLVPLFLLLAIISWSLSMSFIFLGIGSSDLCYNSPDIPILNLLETVEDDFDSLVFLFLRYYVSGCPSLQAPTSLETSVAVIQENVLPSFGTLVDAIQAQGEDALEETCGTPVAPLLAIIRALGNQICVLASSMADLRSLFQCDLWYPLYRATMHDAICSNATQGFAWAAATQIVIVVLSLVLITLRVSYYELDEILETEETTVGCCACYTYKKAPTVHIGEINIKKQPPPPPPPPPSTDGKVNEGDESEERNIAAEPSSQSGSLVSSSGSTSGSGSIEEISLKD